MLNLHTQMLIAQEYAAQIGRVNIGITSIAALLPRLRGGLLPADAPQPVPLERWDIATAGSKYERSADTRFGAFVAGADRFDASAFHISR